MIISIICFLVATEYVLPYWAIIPFKRKMALLPSTYGLVYENIELEAEQGLKLRGYLIHALGKKPLGTVIQLHGIGSCKETYIPFAGFLAKHGFNVLIYDQRAHGDSDGRYCTFGQYEKLDVSKFVDALKKRFPKLPIGIHGSSLGGAVALQALAHDKRIGFGIVESTFNTLENVVVEYGRDYFKFRSTWLAKRILNKAAVIARFNPFDIKPVEACKDIEQPILLAHGDMDEKIPIGFNQDNFSALKSQDKEFYIVKGANHDNVGEIGGEVYRQKILDFLKRKTTALVGNSQ
jgi:alpha-beta hydrolase superfamily lysophospholipase